MALRVAEAPQLAQGLASDAKTVGLVLPLLPPGAIDAADMAPTLAAGPAHESFSLAAVANELSFQSAMAELLSMVRLEGAAAVDSAAMQAASANAAELLLASANGEDGASVSAPQPQHASQEQPPQPEADGLRSATPVFVDAAFGNIGLTVLSLQNKDLFGFDGIKEAFPPQTAGLDSEPRAVIDYDLFGSDGANGSVAASISKIGDPAGIGGGTTIPIDSGTASIGGNPDNGKTLAGIMKLAVGEQSITLDLQGVLAKADDAHNLVVRGDGDDHLKLVGDWVLVSENAEENVSVYAHSDSGTTVTAEHVEVVLA